MKKFLSIMLSVAMIFSMSATAFAADDTQKYIEDGIQYLSIYNEEKGTVQAVQKNIETGECVYGPEIAVNENINAGNISRVIGADIHQDTFLNFEYDIWETSPREWNLERPASIFSQEYFRCYENSSNRSELNDWKDDVDALNAQEWVVIGGIGVSAYQTVKAYIESHAAIASGGILTAAAIDSIKDACVALGATGVAIGLLCTTYNNCAMSFVNVMEETDNIHY
jgi:hypothetical protein